jgi:hypothetical protein
MTSIFRDVLPVRIIIIFLMIDLNVLLSLPIVWKLMQLIIMSVKVVPLVMDWPYNILLLLRPIHGFVSLQITIRLLFVVLRIILIKPIPLGLVVLRLINFISMVCYVQIVLIRLYQHSVDINASVIPNWVICMITI